MKPIELDEIKVMNDVYNQNPVNTVVRHALTNQELAQAALVNEAQDSVKDSFSCKIDTQKVTYQMQSGRCWLFAACNVLREIVKKKTNVEYAELSQNYLAFWDKFEKVNFFLESVIELKDKDFDDRTLNWVLKGGIGDGGQWDMFVALVKKYGVVPKDIMPETYQSSHTRDMNKLLNRRLRRFAYELSKVTSDDEVAALKATVVQEVYTYLCSCFGVPPTTFTYDFVDKDGNHTVDKDLTPLSFYDKYVGLNLDEYVSIINAPTDDKPYYRLFTVEYLGNVVNHPVQYLNLPMDEFKQMVVDQLKSGEVVWFGSDCGNYGNRVVGYWDPLNYDYTSMFGIDFKIDKAVSLQVADSAMNHAMVLTGVNLVDDKPNRWRIENSWGKDPGHEGYFVASDVWFDQYVYQAVVHKDALSDKAKAAFTQDTISLKPWDPMGTLAD